MSERTRRSREVRDPGSPDPEELSLKAYGYILANARSNPLRTGATITAVAVAVTFLIVVSSLSVGLEGSTQRALLDYTVGTPELPISDFIQTEEGNFIGLFATQLFDPKDVTSIQHTAQTEVGSASEVRVYPYTERLIGRSYFAGLDYLVGRLLGVDPELGVTTPYTTYHTYSIFSSGGPLENMGGGEVVLGQQLWKDLFPNASVGDTIDLQAEDVSWFEASVQDLRSSGPLNLQYVPGLSNLRVMGILDKDLSTDHNAYVPLGYMANMTMGGWTVEGPRCEATSVEVLNDDVNMLALGEELRQTTPRVSSYFVTSTASPANTKLAEGLRASIYSWLVLAVAVIMVGMVLGIATTSFLSVSQRMREIGTLRALGLSSDQVRKLVQWEALFIGMMGGVIGFFSGHILSSTVLNVVLELEDLGIWLAPGRTVPVIALGAVIAVLVASFVGAEIPARRAAAMSPVEALSYPL